jgi:hypothetical protein
MKVNTAVSQNPTVAEQIEKANKTINEQTLVCFGGLCS